MHVVARRLAPSLNRPNPSPIPRTQSKVDSTDSNLLPPFEKLPNPVHDRRSRFGSHARSLSRARRRTHTTRRPSDTHPHRDACSRIFSGGVVVMG